MCGANILKTLSSPMRKMASAAGVSGGDSIQEALMQEMCIVVDPNDNIVGEDTKKACHLKENILNERKMLHRAFSVFLLDQRGNLLLQQRSLAKLTYPGLWSNTCCSHPLAAPHFEMDGWAGAKRAAIRKLSHELGVSLSTLNPSDFYELGRIHYIAENSLKDSPYMEHEIDYLLLAQKEVSLELNPNEVKDVKYVSQTDLGDILSDPIQSTTLTPWFKMICNERLFRVWDEFIKGTLSKYIPANEDVITRFSSL